MTKSRRVTRGSSANGDVDRGSATELALDADSAAVGARDVLRDGEPEAGTASDLLGREKRLKDVLEVAGRDALCRRRVMRSRAGRPPLA
jgi:hypothetical protein